MSQFGNGVNLEIVQFGNWVNLPVGLWWRNRTSTWLGAGCIQHIIFRRVLSKMLHDQCYLILVQSSGDESVTQSEVIIH
jgi:hypothetical protein